MAARARSSGASKLIAALILVVVVGLGVGFAPAYWRAAQTLDAVQRSDEAALAARVDFPVLRADIESDLSKALDAHYAAAGADDTTQSLAAIIVRPFLNAVVDQAASPAGFATMAREALGPDYQPKGMGELVSYVTARARFAGLGTFAVQVGEDDAPTSLIFARRGLDWKLAGVDFPPRALKLPE